MIAVKWSDYIESGCVNCGCEFCYADHISGPTTPLICGECNTEFIVISDDLQISSIGFSKDGYDGLVVKEGSNGEVSFDGLGIEQLLSNAENGTSINEIVEKLKKGIAIEDNGFVYPIPGKHPRKGTPKHKFVRPDIRPENGIGDFCNPRGVGYDLACFVKSKEAGQRITDMINKINEEYDNKGFSCWLDYREHEPLWIQVKINYPNEMKATLLAGLIKDNGNVITEDIVRKAMDMQLDFATYWRYKASGSVYSAVETSFLHDIIGKPEELSQEQRNQAYKWSFQRNNYLDQFEVWGAYKQIDRELEKGNTENAVAIARHLVDLNGDHFNYELMLQRGKERDYITRLRGNLHEELVNAINIHYKRTKQFEKKTDGKQTCDYSTISEYANISDDAKQQFLSDWQSIVPMLFKVVDLKTLKMATDLDILVKDNKDEITKLNQALNKYPNLYAMFSLFGLYVQVSRNIEEGQIENDILAAQHVASQQNSPLFEQLQRKTKNDDIQALMTQAVYAQISSMVSKYYGKQNQTESPRKSFK